MGNSKEVFIGIDVSKDTLDVFVLPSENHWKTDNSEEGILQLISRLKESQPFRVVLEATGGYETALVGLLVDSKLPVVVVNPRLVRDFAKSMGITAKTDKIDARVIALFAQRNCPELRELPNEETRELSDLISRRSQLLGILKAEKTRLHQASKMIKPSIERHIDWLKKELESTNRDLDHRVRQSPIWQAGQTILRSVPGVGPVTTFTLLADLPELGKVSGKKIASLVGVAPFNCDSGKYRGKRRIWGGRSQVRTTLYMAALTAVRFNSRIKTFYESLRKIGKEYKVAITACMRKLLVMINAMMRDKTQWDENVATT